MEHVDQNSTKDGKNENNIQTQVVYIKYVHILYVNHTLIKWILKKNETLCSSFFYKISASILTVSWKEKYAGEEEWCSADPVSYTHLTLPTIHVLCRSRWSPYH